MSILGHEIVCESRLSMMAIQFVQLHELAAGLCSRSCRLGTNWARPFNLPKIRSGSKMDAAMLLGLEEDIVIATPGRAAAVRHSAAQAHIHGRQI
jgi:hypothetical protein